jgi:DNA-binding transcriptional MerR regulator
MRLYSLNELSKESGISYTYLRIFKRDGDLTGTRIMKKGHFLYTLTDLENALISRNNRFSRKNEPLKFNIEKIKNRLGYSN